MALSWRARRRLSLVLLALWLPLYIAAALWATSLFERPSFFVEIAVYAGLGLAWALPFRAVFRGVGRAPPEGDSRRDGPEGS